jgi:hypothetical protein
VAASGAVLFARYAYPPNELGYCGPADPHTLLEYSSTGLDDHTIADRARAFEGAWVYLELIARATGIIDPLDPDVVKAYWIGNDLLTRVEPGRFLTELAERFSDQTGGFWNRLDPAHQTQARPHHSFQVFAVYPWAALLDAPGGVALSVMDRCRIRWGQVQSLDGERAEVRSQPLEWDGSRLHLGAEQQESVRWSHDGRSLAPPPSVGSWVALHWDWICDEIDPQELRELQSASADQLELTNRHLASLAREEQA